MNVAKTTCDDVLNFWIDEVGIERWYMSTTELDEEITRRFGDAYSDARDGLLDHWQDDARGSLALLLLLDQFPRNMFRGDARAFATDSKARSVARAAVERGQDMEIEGAERQFFYLPFEHSESLDDQEYGLEKYSAGMPDAALSLLHMRAHLEIIREFGRFPFRNEALRRDSTEAEKRFMADGGYMNFVDELEARERAG